MIWYITSFSYHTHKSKREGRKVRERTTNNGASLSSSVCVYCFLFYRALPLQCTSESLESCLSARWIFHVLFKSCAVFDIEREPKDFRRRLFSLASTIRWWIDMVDGSEHSSRLNLHPPSFLLFIVHGRSSPLSVPSFYPLLICTKMLFLALKTPPIPLRWIFRWLKRRRRRETIDRQNERCSQTFLIFFTESHFKQRRRSSSSSVVRHVLVWYASMPPPLSSKKKKENIFDQSPPSLTMTMTILTDKSRAPALQGLGESSWLLSDFFLFFIINIWVQVPCFPIRWFPLSPKVSLLVLVYIQYHMMYTVFFFSSLFKFKKRKEMCLIDCLSDG